MSSTASRASTIEVVLDSAEALQQFQSHTPFGETKTRSGIPFKVGLDEALYSFSRSGAL